MLASEHGVDEEELQDLLDEGYTLVEVESALIEAKNENISIDRALDQVSKQFLNISDTAESEIIDRTDEYIEQIDPELEAKIKAQKQKLQQQINAGLSSIPELPTINANPNPDAAPYLIDFQNDYTGSMEPAMNCIKAVSIKQKQSKAMTRGDESLGKKMRSEIGILLCYHKDQKYCSVSRGYF